MLLAELIAQSDSASVRAVAQSTLADVQSIGHTGLCAQLDSSLRTLAYIQPAVLSRLPPSFSILAALLEAPEYSLSVEQLKQRAHSHVLDICNRIESNGLLEGDE